MALAERIKAERSKLKLSQETLAQKMHVSRQAISKWETGQNYPDLDKLIQMSELFGLTVDDLLKADKKFEKKLIEDGKKMNGIEILGIVLAALGAISVVLGFVEHPANLMNSDFMSLIVIAAVLITTGAALISAVPSSITLLLLWMTVAAVVVYLIGFKMPVIVLITGIVVCLGVGWWLTTLLLK